MNKRAFVTNAEFYGHPTQTGAKLNFVEAFTEWCRRGGVSDPGTVKWSVCLEFAAAPAMRILQYQTGHLFKVVGAVGVAEPCNGCFATIDRFHPNGLSLDWSPSSYGQVEGSSVHNHILADVVLADGSVRSQWLGVENIGKAEVPPQILSLAKAQLRAGCPLKKEGACLED